MPAARIKPFQFRAAHEAREITHPAAQLPCRASKQHHVVGGLQRLGRRERAFDLTRAPLVFERPDRQVQLRERARQSGERTVHPVEVGLGMERVSRLGRMGAHRPSLDPGRADMLVRQMLLGQPKQIPFDFEPDDAAHRSLLQPRELLAKQMAGREVKRPAGTEIIVAQDPADIGLPWQHAKGRGIRHHDKIGRPGHFLQPEAAATRERREDAGTRAVQHRGGDVDIVTALERRQERLRRYHFGARRAVGIAPGNPHQPDIFAFEPRGNLRGLAALIVGPEPVLFDESSRLGHGFLLRQLSVRGMRLAQCCGF